MGFETAWDWWGLEVATRQAGGDISERCAPTTQTLLGLTLAIPSARCPDLSPGPDDVSSLGAGTSSLCPQGLSSRREVAGVLPWRGLDVEQSGKNVEGGDKLRSGGPAACLGRGPLGRARVPTECSDKNCPLLLCRNCHPLRGTV